MQTFREIWGREGSDLELVAWSSRVFSRIPRLGKTEFGLCGRSQGSVFEFGHFCAQMQKLENSEWYTFPAWK